MRGLVDDFAGEVGPLLQTVGKPVKEDQLLLELFLQLFAALDRLLPHFALVQKFDDFLVEFFFQVALCPAIFVLSIG